MKKQLRLTSLSILAATLLLGSTATMAHANYKGDLKGERMPEPCPPIKVLKDGFYVGAQVGYDVYGVRDSVGIVGVDEGDGLALNPTLYANGAIGGLFGGYGMYFQNLYYLALEIYGNYSGASTSYNYLGSSPGELNDRLHTKVNARGSYGISVLPGIKLNDSTLAYLRLGYNRANIKGQESSTNFDGVAFSVSNSNWTGGFNYGIGLESVVWDNFSVRGEFNYTSYSSFSDPITETRFSPANGTFMVGLVYHFDQRMWS